MVSKIQSLLKSRQFWMIVILFIINGFEGVKNEIPEGVLPYVDTILGFLIVWFRISPKQDFSPKKSQ